jgi:hypothetical protein
MDQVRINRQNTKVPQKPIRNPVLRIRDVYPGSRILIFTHPGSRIPDLGSRIPDPKKATKERDEKN